MRAGRLRPVRNSGIHAVAGSLAAAAFTACACLAAAVSGATGAEAVSTSASEYHTPTESFTELETLVVADTIFEGPVWVRRGRSGYLLFSDVPGDAIKRLNPDGTVSVVASNIFKRHDASGAYQSSGAHKFAMVGPNGITLDPRGRVVYCAFSDGEIVRIERDGSRTVLAAAFEGKHFNAPNDLAYGPDGSLYFTDSRAGTNRGNSEGVSHKGLYRLKSGRVELLSGDIDHPNGVALSPDGRHLYVTNTLRKNILRFDVARGVSSTRSGSRIWPRTTSRGVPTA